MGPTVFPNYERGEALPMGTREIRPIGGMSLRDYFAAKAMQAHLAQHTMNGGLQPLFDVNADGHAESIAHLSYAMADAMLKAREGK